MKKQKAFTIMEMLVGMVITSLVAAAAWTAWDIISRQQTGFMRQNGEVKNLQMFDARISEDFDRCLLARKTDEGIRLSFDKTQIEYHFAADYILRCDENGCDTLKCSSDLPEFRFGENKVLMRDSLIDSFQIEALCNKEKIKFRYEKKYPAATLMRMKS